MTQNRLITKKVSNIGEDIGLELGTQMVKAFQVANPNEAKSFIVGRKILESILGQPNCAGIQIYNAINEEGKRTLVFIGLDNNGNNILKYSVITETGVLETNNAIVADRIRERMPSRTGEEFADDETFWSFD